MWAKRALLGLNHNRHDHRPAAVLGVDPTPHGTTNDLAEHVGVPGTLAGRFFESTEDRRSDVIEDRIVRGEAAGVDFWPDDDFPSLRIDGEEDGDESLFGQNPAVFQVRIGDLAHRGAIDVDKPDVKLSGLTCDTCGHVDDRTVFAHQRRFGGNPRVDGDLGVGA